MKKAIIGYGGHAREVLSQMGKKLPCFVDDNYVSEETLPLSSLDVKKYKVMVAIANHIGHDTIVGDYFSSMPGSIISGNCTIGDSVYLGTNSSVREKITICDNVTVGLNSGVVKNINKSGTYVGLPSKKIK